MLYFLTARRGARRERIGKLRGSGGAVPRRSCDADYRDVRGLWLPCIDLHSRRAPTRLRRAPPSIMARAVVHSRSEYFLFTRRILPGSGWRSSKSLGDAVILLIFAFVGIEVALIPSGNEKPSTHSAAQRIRVGDNDDNLTMIQLVAQGTLVLQIIRTRRSPNRQHNFSATSAG